VAAMRPRIRSDLAVVEVDGEAVIYDQADGAIHHLNPTATLVLKLLDGSATAKELAADIAEAYDLSPQEVERQVRALIREFRKSNLLEGSLVLAKSEGDRANG